MQDTVCALSIKLLFPSFAQNISCNVIDEQSAGGAFLQHVLASSKILHVGVEHCVLTGFSINPAPPLLQKVEGSEIDWQVAASAAGLQQCDASVKIKHWDEAHCSFSG
jgi:hypothetical protein